MARTDPGFDVVHDRIALIHLIQRRDIPPFVLVLAHVRRSHPGRALDSLAHAGDARGFLLTAKVNPLFDPLRSDPRFVSVLERLHLAD